MKKVLKQSQEPSSPVAPSVSDRAWHTMTPNEIESQFGTNSSTGLDKATVQLRLTQFGPNRLIEDKQQTIWQVFLEEIREPLILLLLGTGVLYAVWGSIVDALTSWTRPCCARAASTTTSASRCPPGRAAWRSCGCIRATPPWMRE
jgi:magnesium-transporting ATPase (P-type)